MSNGWVSIHRQILDWEWFTDVNTSHLFIYCLLKANHKDAKWRGLSVSRGAFVTSYESLSHATGLSVQQVRTSLDKLKATGEVTSKSTNKNTMISITNYEFYQDSNKQITNEQQSNNNQITTDNNINNINNGNNILFPVSQDVVVCDLEYALSMYQNVAEAHGLPKVMKFTATRKKHLQARLNDCGGVKGWELAMQKLASSPFLTGKTDKRWQANFDFVVRESSFIKLMEGFYDKRGAGSASETKQELMEWIYE